MPLERFIKKILVNQIYLIKPAQRENSCSNTSRKMYYHYKKISAYKYDHIVCKTNPALLKGISSSKYKGLTIVIQQSYFLYIPFELDNAFDFHLKLCFIDVLVNWHQFFLWINFLVPYSTAQLFLKSLCLPNLYVIDNF